MRRHTYAALMLVSNLVSVAALAWLFAGRITTGVEEHLPAKNAATYAIAVVAIVITGGWWQVVKPPRTTRNGIAPATAAAILKLARLVGLVALLRFTAPLVTTQLGMFSTKLDLPAALLWTSAFCVATTVLRLMPVFLKHALPCAEDVMARDTRRPVLYLRSFDKELRRAPGLRWTRVVRNYLNSDGGYYVSARLPGEHILSSRARTAINIGSRRTGVDEQMVLAQAFERIGPYIAIGRPNESYRDMDLGAAKKYVGDNEWREIVAQWLTECAAVVVEAGDSAGLGWEIEQVVQLVPPRRVIVICPYTDDEYETFLQAHGRRFPRGLPARRPASRFLVFQEGWRARALANINLNASHTLAPFFAQVGTNLDLSS